MFSNKTQLQKRTPENGTDRENFLSLLVDEYLNSTSNDAKCQVLANLANFAYDPINYGYIRDVGALDIFLYVVKNENNLKLIHFAISGVCNLCLDPANVDYILTHMGLKPIVSLLKLKHTEIVGNSITTLMFLFNDQTKSEINTTEVKSLIEEFSKSENKMLGNLATIFLTDICLSN